MSHQATREWSIIGNHSPTRAKPEPDRHAVAVGSPDSRQRIQRALEPGWLMDNTNRSVRRDCAEAEQQRPAASQETPLQLIGAVLF